MKIRSALIGDDWKPVDPDPDVEGSVGYREVFKNTLVDFLRSDNLVVLSGLGTSLCVSDGEGNRPAPTMTELWDAVRTQFGEETFDSLLKTVRYSGYRHVRQKGTPTKKRRLIKDIERLLSQCQVSQAFRPNDTVAQFIKDAEAEIVARCSFLDDTLQLPTHESFLRRIARRSTRLPRTKIFTTNYDLCFETAASRIHFVAVDGFSHTIPQEFDGGYFAYDLVRRDENGTTPDFVPNVFHLYKLHGSVDWQRSDNAITKQAEPDDPVLIYPRYSKFESSYEHPFLELMSRFQSAIRQPKTSLLVIGFGFNDKHLTQPILSAIRSNVGLRLAVVDPTLEETKNVAAKTMADLINQGDSRISLIAARFEEFVQCLPDLVAVTEEERHKARIRGGDHS